MAKKGICSISGSLESEEINGGHQSEIFINLLGGVVRDHCEMVSVKDRR